MTEFDGLQILEEKVKSLMDKCRALMDENAHLKRIIEERDEKISSLEADIAQLNEDKAMVRSQIGSIIELIESAGILDKEGLVEDNQEEQIASSEGDTNWEG